MEGWQRGNVPLCGTTLMEVTMFKMSDYGFISDEDATFIDSDSKRRIEKWYSVWTSMASRCYNINHVHYDKYGGNGVIVSDEFKIASNFKKFYCENNPDGVLDIDKDISGLMQYSRDGITFISHAENMQNIDSSWQCGEGNNKSKEMEAYEVEPTMRSNFKKTCSVRNWDFNSFEERYSSDYISPSGKKIKKYTYHLLG